MEDPDLALELMKQFPKLFPNAQGYPEVGDGWLQIIESLCSRIQHYIDWANESRARLLKDNPYNHPIPDEVQQVVVAQIKEKFGGLRFYYDGGDSRIYGMVAMAESWAAHSCEVCGDRGRARDTGWVKTLCDKHHEEREAVRKARLAK